MQTYKGQCHCGKVRFEVDTDLAETMVCNCSHCSKKGLILHFVDENNFRITDGEKDLGLYQFNKKQIDHLFCRHCGTQPFARGKAFGKACINVRCLDDVELDSLSPKPFNGKDR